MKWIKESKKEIKTMNDAIKFFQGGGEEEGVLDEYKVVDGYIAYIVEGELYLLSEKDFVNEAKTQQKISEEDSGE